MANRAYKFRIYPNREQEVLMKKTFGCCRFVYNRMLSDTTRFFPSICLPHLSRMIPCSYRASTWLAVLPSCVTSYVVSVRQARGLPVVSLFPHPASFRSHLAMSTLAFGCILPSTGRIRDFHPLETCAAGRTKKQRPGRFPPGALLPTILNT